jgi:hypothetical protein
VEKMQFESRNVEAGEHVKINAGGKTISYSVTVS